MTSSNSQPPYDRHWLVLAVCMLALSGIFSLIIVFARTPGLYDIPYIQKLFHESLVIHVDLLVLCWPLCIAGMMWAMFCPSRFGKSEILLVHILAMLFVVVGSVQLTMSPLDIHAEPLKNNYIPIITSSVFLNGLSLIGMGAALLAFHAVYLNKRNHMHDVSLLAVCNWGARGIGIIVLFALVAVYVGFKHTSPEFIGEERYYESAVWAGGHLLQFAYTQMQMLAWLWVFYKITNVELNSYQLVRAIFLLNVCIGCLGIYGILAYDTLSFEYNQFYTNHMIMGGGIAPGLFLIYLLYSYFKHKMNIATHVRFLLPALIVSIGLFLYGGILGLLIQGQDVTIPAHYHGSTISVTIALMGFAYAYLAHETPITLPTKLIKWQPIIYGGGQFFHITGLAVSGGYGVLRKTPGLDEGFSSAKLAMGVMGLGGLLAVIGGLLFVYIMWVCLRCKQT